MIKLMLDAILSLRSGTAEKCGRPTTAWESLMTFMTKFLSATTALALTAGVAFADGHASSPAIIYDLGGNCL